MSSDPKPAEGETAQVESGSAPPKDEKKREDGKKCGGFFARIKNAQSSSDSKTSFASHCCKIFTDSIGFAIANAILLALPIAMITVGAIHIDNCPVERFVPIWLIVAGTVAAFPQLVVIFDIIWKKCTKKEEGDKQDQREHRLYSSIIFLFNLAWFIAGNVWVFRVYAPNTKFPGQPRYCQHGTYYFAFWLIIVAYILMLLGLCGFSSAFGCLYRGVAKAAGRPTEEKPVEPEPEPEAEKKTTEEV